MFKQGDKIKSKITDRTAEFDRYEGTNLVFYFNDKLFPGRLTIRPETLMKKFNKGEFFRVED